VRNRVARTIAVSVVLLGALAVAAPAQGASPVITLDSTPQSYSPSVAVAPDGVGHVVWQRTAATGDEIHYCRLPRGAAGCDRQETFVPDDANSFGNVHVLVREDGSVQIVTGRCCFPGDRTLLIESTDGGASFAAARQIGDIAPESVVAGPGPNAITASVGGAASGALSSVEVMATDGGITSSRAGLQDGDGRWYEGGVGMIDSSTPIFAYGDLTNTFIRRFDATQSGYNDGASWLPSTTIPNESDADLVTGTAGTYVMTKVSASQQDTYRVRRISQTDGTLGAPVDATDTGDPIFARLSADQGGGLTSVWTVPGGEKPIYARAATTGGAFSKTATLVEKATAFNFDSSTAPDHGGFVVWDGNTGGAVSAAAIPPGGPVADKDEDPPGKSGCDTAPKKLKTGVVATLSGGCWKDLKSGRYETVGDVNVNGIVFATDGKTTKVTIDTNKHRISAGKGVVEKAGSVVLAKDAVDWDLDAGPKVFQGLDKAGLGGKPIRLFDFPVVGEADVTFVTGGARLGVNLELPAPFDAITGRSVLAVTPAGGLQRKGVEIHVVNASIGPFRIKKLDVVYDGDLSLFSGKASLQIPPTGGDVDAGITFRNGELESLHASYENGAPFPFAITPYLWLKGVGFSYSKVGGFTIGGGALFGIPTAPGPFELDALGDPPGTGGGFKFFIPSGKSYADMTLAARLEVFGFDIGGFSGTFRTTGKFWFTSDLSIGVPGVVGIFGGVKGDFDLPKQTFSAQGDLSACVLLCVGAKATASNIGVSVCPEITFGIDPFSFELTFLVGYKFKGGLDAGLGCDQGSYLPAKDGPPPTKDDVGSKADVTLKAGNVVQLPPDVGDPYTIGMEVQGSGGLPGVRITNVGTGETVIESDPDDLTKPVQAGTVVMVPNAGTNSVRLMILRTGKGQLIPDEWRIEQVGGAPIAFRRAAPNGARNADGTRATISGISFAREYDKTVVKARLSGKGRARTVAYDATNLTGPNRSVEFVELGAKDDDGVARVIGTTRKAKGTLKYTIFDGEAGLRRIVARVRNFDGLAVDAQTVASYRAPGPVLPGKAKKVRFRWSGSGKLKVTWKGNAGAASRVVVATVADGRILRFTPKRNTVTIPAVGKKEKVTVTIRGVTKLGRQGPATKAKR